MKSIETETLIDYIVQEGKILNVKKEDVEVLFKKQGSLHSATVIIEDDTLYFARRPLSLLVSWIRQYIRFLFSDPMICQYTLYKSALQEVGIDPENDLLDQYEADGNNTICKMILRRGGINFRIVQSESMPTKMQARVQAISLMCQWF